LAAKKTLSNRLTNRYLLIIRNEENFAEKTTLSFTYSKVILILFAVFLVIFTLSIYLVTGVLEEWLDPRHAQLESEREVVKLTMAIDSMELEMRQQDLYTENVRRIFSGNDDIYAEVEDRQLTEDQIAQNNVANNNPQAIDRQFKKEFEKESQGRSINSYRSDAEALQEVFLFNPLGKDGIVISKFDPKINHFGLDVLAKKDEPIKAAGDGTVIFSDWTLDSGYVIAVQHKSNLISVYKHNSEKLKEVGNFVSQGEIISIIGNTGELTTGPHLHFELWYNGSPVDPEEFIDF